MMEVNLYNRVVSSMSFVTNLRNQVFSIEPLRLSLSSCNGLGMTFTGRFQRAGCYKGRLLQRPNPQSQLDDVQIWPRSTI